MKTRIKTGWILTMAGMFLLHAPPLIADSKAPPLAFDLFGVQLLTADQGLGKRAAALAETLPKAFPQAMAKHKIQANNYGGICFVSDQENFQLAWYDSETEGYRLSIEKLQDRKKCPSPFTSGLTFPTAKLNPAQFFPVSRTHPAIQLGVSTLAQVRQEMGKAEYEGSDILVYSLRRDREKEKACEMNPAQGELAAVAVQFRFKQGLLQSIELVNHIAGEC